MTRKSVFYLILRHNPLELAPLWTAASIAALDLVRIPETQANPKGFQMQ